MSISTDWPIRSESFAPSVLNIDGIWGSNWWEQHHRRRLAPACLQHGPVQSLWVPVLVRPVQSSNQPFAVPACVRNDPLLGPWPEASFGSGTHGWCPSNHSSTAQAELSSTQLNSTELKLRIATTTARRSLRLTLPDSRSRGSSTAVGSSIGRSQAVLSNSSRQ